MTLLSNVLTQGDLEIKGFFRSEVGLSAEAAEPRDEFTAYVTLLFDKEGYVTIDSKSLFEVCPHFVTPSGENNLSCWNRVLYWPSRVSMQELEFSLSRWISARNGTWSDFIVEVQTGKEAGLPYDYVATNMEDASRRAIVPWKPRIKMTVQDVRRLIKVDSTRVAARSIHLAFEKKYSFRLAKPQKQDVDALLVWADAMSERGLIKEK